MRKLSYKAYAPFVALAVLQGAVMLIAPSTGPDRQVVAGFGETPGGGAPGSSGFAAAGGGAVDPVTGQPTAAAGSSVAPGADAAATAGGATADPTAAAGGSDRAAAGAAPGATGGEGGAAAAAGGAGGDMSHCTPDGKQHGFFAFPEENPRCVPRFEGDNGGATYKGVSAEQVKILYFEPVPNEAVNAVLRPQGLAATDEDLEKVRQVAESFINKHYETYGRKVVIERFKSNCPLTPPDVPRCKAEAREALKRDPFIVIFSQPTYAAMFDEWARAGVISLGGWHFSGEFFNQRRPYRYDVFMDGTQSAHIIAEYYCKKLAGKPASNAGVTIHPTMPQGRDTPRKLGIVVPEIEANVATAKIVQRLVKECEGGTYEPPIFTYVSDIDRAAEQTATTTQGLISAKVTTVVCMCDPVAPAFGTKGYTSNGYFPEHLLPGLGLLDHDKLGRLYDQDQWQHAFGPSHLPNSRAFKDEQVSRVFAAEKSGEPCLSCNLPWVYYGMAASMIQSAGPNLNPLTVEQGMLNAEPTGGWERTGGNGRLVMVDLGQNDYTAISDVREAWWNPTARSEVDGGAGAYVPVDDGRRYVLGQWPSSFTIAPAAR